MSSFVRVPAPGGDLYVRPSAITEIGAAPHDRRLDQCCQVVCGGKTLAINLGIEAMLSICEEVTP